MLLGLLDVPQLHAGEGQAVHSLRVFGVGLIGAAQVVKRPQAIALLAEDRAQVLEGHWATGVGCQGLRGVFFSLREVAQLQVGDPQGHAGVGVLRRDLQAAEQVLYAPVGLAGGEELEGAGEVVGVGHGEISPEKGLGD